MTDEDAIDDVTARLTGPLILLEAIEDKKGKIIVGAGTFRRMRLALPEEWAIKVKVIKLNSNQRTTKIIGTDRMKCV